MDFISCSGSSKQRRDLLKNETDQLGKALPFEYGKVSQLRILKAACNYLKKEKYFANLRSVSEKDQIINRIINYNETIKNESFSGFIVCFTKCGDLVYITETSYEHLGMRSLDILFVYDKIQDLIHEQDKHNLRNLEDDFSFYQNGENTFSFYSLWYASKTKRTGATLSDYKLIKMTGHFDVKTKLFFATCTQILSVSNRELLVSLSSDCFTSIHDSTLKFKEIDTNIENLLSYDLLMDDFKNKSLYEIISSEYLSLVKERHLKILNEKNIKGCLDPVKIQHKNGHFIDCLINMYCDLKGQIVCKFQIISHSSMNDYKDYVSNFKTKWNSYLINENPTPENSLIQIDESSFNRNENEESNFLYNEKGNNLKRKRIDSECSENEESIFKKANMLDLDDVTWSEFPFTSSPDNGTSSIGERCSQTTGFLDEFELGDLRFFDLNDLIEIQKIEKVIKEEVSEVSEKNFSELRSSVFEYEENICNINIDEHFFHSLTADENFSFY